MTRQGVTWTPEDLARLDREVEAVRGRDKTIDWRSVGEAMERGSVSCRCQYWLQQKRKRGVPSRRSRGGQKGVTRAELNGRAVAARAELLSLPPRTLTAEFFGDPMPGRSAYDRKLRGDVEPEHIDHRNAHLARKPSLPTRPWR
jgi:hypothetical protein